MIEARRCNEKLTKGRHADREMRSQVRSPRPSNIRGLGREKEASHGDREVTSEIRWNNKSGWKWPGGLNWFRELGEKITCSNASKLDPTKRLIHVIDWRQAVNSQHEVKVGMTIAKRQWRVSRTRAEGRCWESHVNEHTTYSMHFFTSCLVLGKISSGLWKTSLFAWNILNL